MYNLDDEERLSAYLDGELIGEERQRVEQRLADDAAYHRLHDELRALRHRLAALPSHRLEPDFGLSVLDAAERRMLAPHGADDDEQFAASWPRRWLRPLVWSGLSVAAALMLMLLTPSERKRDDEARHDNLAPRAATPKAAALNDAAHGNDQRPSTWRETESSPSRELLRKGNEAAEQLMQSGELSKAEGKSDDSPQRASAERGVAASDKLQTKSGNAPESATDGERLLHSAKSVAPTAAAAPAPSARAAAGLGLSAQGQAMTPSLAGGAASPGDLGKAAKVLSDGSRSARDGGKIAAHGQDVGGAFGGGSSSGRALRRGQTPVLLSFSVATSAEAAQGQTFERLLANTRPTSVPNNKRDGKPALDKRANVQKKKPYGERKQGKDKVALPAGGNEGAPHAYQADLTYDQLVDLLAQLRTRPAQFQLGQINRPLERDVARRAEALAALKLRPGVADALKSPMSNAVDKSAIADRKAENGQAGQAKAWGAVGASERSQVASQQQPAAKRPAGDVACRVRFVVRVISGPPTPAAPSAGPSPGPAKH